MLSMQAGMELDLVMLKELKYGDGVTIEANGIEFVGKVSDVSQTRGTVEVEITE